MDEINHFPTDHGFTRIEGFGNSTHPRAMAVFMASLAQCWPVYTSGGALPSPVNRENTVISSPKSKADPGKHTVSTSNHDPGVLHRAYCGGIPSLQGHIIKRRCFPGTFIPAFLIHHGSHQEGQICPCNAFSAPPQLSLIQGWAILILFLKAGITPGIYLLNGYRFIRASKYRISPQFNQPGKIDYAPIFRLINGLKQSFQRGNRHRAIFRPL